MFSTTNDPMNTSILIMKWKLNAILIKLHELSDARVNGKSLQLASKVSFNYPEKT